MSTAVRNGRPRLRATVERELEAVVARHTAAAQAYGPEFAHLWALAARHLRGGKLVRPVLLLEAYDALRLAQGSALAAGSAEPRGGAGGVSDRDEVVRLAAAVETLHYAFLLHDDVIDGDLVRRGRPNLIGELADGARGLARAGRARHWGRAGGILAGDLLLSAAHQLFARVDAPAECRTRLLDLLEHTIVETTAGELADVGLGDGVIAPDLGAVLAMTARKTASYTFELPLRAAAIVAGGSPELESVLSSAGAHLGLAYQLQDDLLSTFGDADLHGKDPYSDLREGKQTAISCFARMTSAWPSIEADFGDPRLSEASARRVRDLLTECGAERFVRNLIDEQLTAFAEVVAGADEAGRIPAELRAILLDLAGRLEGRQS